MRQLPTSSHTQAKADPAAHHMSRGQGYLRLGKLANNLAEATTKEHLAALAGSPHAPGQCEPPVGVVNGSWHTLIPRGVKESGINFQWNARLQLWARPDPKSRRMGYSPEYLSRAGWTYGHPANGK